MNSIDYLTEYKTERTVTVPLLPRYIVIALLLLVLPLTGIASTQQSNTSALELGNQIQILEDPAGDLTLDQILASDTLPFEPNPHGVISIGRSKSTFWFRFKLPDTGQTDTQWLLQVAKQSIGALDLFVPVESQDGKTRYKRIAFGSWRTPPEENIPSRMHVVTLPRDRDAGAYTYLKVKSNITINFPLRLVSAATYIERSLPDLYGFGILFGIFAGMILYNLGIFIFLRDLAYLFYVLYVASLFWYLSILYGHFEMVFTPDPAEFIRLYFAASGATWFFSCLFVRCFLNTRVHAPRFDKMILTLIVLSFIPVVAAFTGHIYWAHKVNTIQGVIYAPLAMLVAIRIWYKGFKPAKYFLAAWSILITGIVLYSIGGVLIPRNAVTIYTLAVGAGVESILLSLALADRIRALQNEKETLIKTERHLRHEAITDPLTGLYNRRFLLETLDAEVRLTETGHHPLSLLMLDVDDFKQFNDTHGHLEGDKVLTALGDVLVTQIREKDSPCRYGGEEFLVILPQTNQTEALWVAQRIGQIFSTREFTPDNQVQRVTVSIGLAQLQEGEDAQKLIHRADQALYRAKHQGKNCIEVS